MEERFMAFIIWGIIGLLFIVMGIYEFHSKKAKPFGFWANAEVSPIEDVKGYKFGFNYNTYIGCNAY